MPLKIEPERLVKISELHTDTAKWVEASQEGPLLVLRHGKPAALLIGLEAFEELLDRLQLKEELERRERLSRGKISLEELEERLAARAK